MSVALSELAPVVRATWSQAETEGFDLAQVTLGTACRGALGSFALVKDCLRVWAHGVRSALDIRRGDMVSAYEQLRPAAQIAAGALNSGNSMPLGIERMFRGRFEEAHLAHQEAIAHLRESVSLLHPYGHTRWIDNSLSALGDFGLRHSGTPDREPAGLAELVRFGRRVGLAVVSDQPGREYAPLDLVENAAFRLSLNPSYLRNGGDDAPTMLFAGIWLRAAATKLEALGYGEAALNTWEMVLAVCRSRRVYDFKRCGGAKLSLLSDACRALEITMTDWS